MPKRFDPDHINVFPISERASLQHRYLPEETKVRLNIPLNIYDAARSYREHQGLQGTPIRDILREERFRNAWGTFKGGYKWSEAGAVAADAEHPYGKKKLYKKKGGIYSTTEEKLKAAQTLGWHGNKREAIGRLRNISP